MRRAGKTAEGGRRNDDRTETASPQQGDGQGARGTRAMTGSIGGPAVYFAAGVRRGRTMQVKLSDALRMRHE